MNWFSSLWAWLKERIGPKSVPWPSPSPPHPVQHTTGGLVDVLNANRVFNGAGDVKEDPKLNEAARVQVDWIASRDRIGHDGPHGQFMLADRVRRAGVVSYAEIGEIAALGYMQDACREWLNSTPHRAILLGSAFKSAGAAIATSPSGRVYSVAVFMR